MGRNSAVRASSSIDAYVGERIRKRRNQAGLSLEVLGKAIGCSMQQLRKYETAENRISAGMLARVSAALSTRPAYFFEGYELLGDELNVEVLYQCPNQGNVTSATPDIERLLQCADEVVDPAIRRILQSLVGFIDPLL